MLVNVTPPKCYNIKEKIILYDETISAPVLDLVLKKTKPTCTSLHLVPGFFEKKSMDLIVSLYKQTLISTESCTIWCILTKQQAAFSLENYDLLRYLTKQTTIPIGFCDSTPSLLFPLFSRLAEEKRVCIVEPLKFLFELSDFLERSYELLPSKLLPPPVSFLKETWVGNFNSRFTIGSPTKTVINNSTKKIDLDTVELLKNAATRTCSNILPHVVASTKVMYTDSSNDEHSSAVLEFSVMIKPQPNIVFLSTEMGGEMFLIVGQNLELRCSDKSIPQQPPISMESNYRVTVIAGEKSVSVFIVLLVEGISNWNTLVGFDVQKKITPCFIYGIKVDSLNEDMSIVHNTTMYPGVNVVDKSQCIKKPILEKILNTLYDSTSATVTPVLLCRADLSSFVFGFTAALRFSWDLKLHDRFYTVVGDISFDAATSILKFETSFDTKQYQLPFTNAGVFRFLVNDQSLWFCSDLINGVQCVNIAVGSESPGISVMYSTTERQVTPPKFKGIVYDIFVDTFVAPKYEATITGIPDTRSIWMFSNVTTFGGSINSNTALISSNTIKV